MEMSEVFPVKPGDWLASNGDDTRVAHVKDVFADRSGIAVNLVLYDVNGERIGRQSPICGGPRTYEPACDFAYWHRINAPHFPLQMKWMPDTDHHGEPVFIAKYDTGPALPNRQWIRPIRISRRLPSLTLPTNNVEIEIASLRRAAQEIRDLSRKHNMPEMIARAVELEKEADALSQ